jgi:Flp pilus assembly protein TadD
LGLVVLIALVFADLRTADFVSFDDDLYVTANAHVASGLSAGNVVWAFSSGYGGNWMPLTWISHMADVELFGVAPGPAHLVNIALHAFSTLVLFAFLVRVTGSEWRSAFVAAIFAIHPLHVESVAWIAQRKDVLSTAILMCAFWAYATYTTSARPRDFAIVAALMALGLMAKPMLVTIPVLLLLLDVWPLRRCEGRTGPAATPTRLIVEKWPLFGMALALGVMTIVLQRNVGAMHDATGLALSSRLANVVQSYAIYLGQTIWPAALAVSYPYPRSFAFGTVATAVGLLAALSAAAWFARTRWPYVAVGWAWFVVAVAPASGLIQVGFQSRGDRFMYVALVGLAVAVAWGFGDLLSGKRAGQFLLGGAAAVAIAGCAVQAHRQVGVWHDGFALWQHTVEVTRDNRAADLAYGIELLAAGRNADAEVWLRRALALGDSDALAQMELGASLSAQGKLAEGIAHLERARALDPGRREVYGLLGQAYIDAGRFDTGIALCIRAADLLPDNPILLTRVAWLLATSAEAAPADAAKAVSFAERAASLTRGQDIGALDALAAAYAATGRFGEAVRVITSAASRAREQGQTALFAQLDQRRRLYQANERLRLSATPR